MLPDIEVIPITSRYGAVFITLYCYHNCCSCHESSAVFMPNFRELDNGFDF